MQDGKAGIVEKLSRLQNRLALHADSMEERRKGLIAQVLSQTVGNAADDRQSFLVRKLIEDILFFEGLFYPL